MEVVEQYRVKRFNERAFNQGKEMVDTLSTSARERVEGVASTSLRNQGLLSNQAPSWRRAVVMKLSLNLDMKRFTKYHRHPRSRIA
jgi:hypothetical protein